MKHINSFDKFLNESLSISNPVPTKEQISKIINACKKPDLKYFEEAFLDAYVSAADWWMGDHQWEKMKELFSSGKYEFITISGESHDGKEDSKMKTLLSAGWEIFDEENNFENYDAILFKEK